MLGVLGIAVGALVLDSVFLRPGTVGAATDYGATPAVPAGDDGLATAAGGVDDQGAAAPIDVIEALRCTVAARLSELSTADSHDDAPLDSLFASPPHWEPERDAAGDEPAAAPEPLQLRLSSVLLGSTPVAIINGTTVGVGDTVEGMRVDRITEGFVLLSDDSGKPRVLRLR